MNHPTKLTVGIREAVPGTDEDVLRALRASVGWSVVETGLAAMAVGRQVVYILEVEGRPAASGAIVLRSDDPDLADGASRALVSNLIVDPEYQGQGMGTKLLAHLERRAAEEGRDTVTIGVDAPNIRARSLYEKHGYRQFKEKIENWGPVVYLKKSLGPASR